MKKGVVVEMKSEYVIVINKGNYYKIKPKDDMDVGEEIIYLEEDVMSTIKRKQAKTKGYKKLIPAIASMFLMVIISAIFLKPSEEVYTVVTVDINPSIELSLDINDQVLLADAMNADATVLDLDGLKGLAADEAIKLIIDLARDAGFINYNEASYVVVTTVDIIEKKESSNDLKIVLEAGLQDVIQDGDIKIAISESTEELLREAEKTEIPLAILNFRETLDIAQVDSMKVFFENEENKTLLEENGLLLEIELEIEDGQLKVEIEIEDDDDELDSLEHDLADLEELLFKLNQVPLEEVEIHTFIARAEAAIDSGSANVKSLKLEAKELWEGVKDKYKDIDDDSIDSVNEFGEDDRNDLVELIAKLQSVSSLYPEMQIQSFIDDALIKIESDDTNLDICNGQALL